MTKIRITVACPEAMMDDANSLAMCLAEGPDDGQTYRPPLWEDAQGNRYALASFEARPEWVTAAQSALQRPAWDVHVDGQDYIVNMAGAERAQAALVFWAPDMGDAPAPSPTTLAAIGGLSGKEAVVMMELSLIDPDTISSKARVVL